MAMERGRRSGMHRVSCPCGEDIAVNPMSQERSLVCPSCKITLNYVIDIDTRTRVPRVSIVVPSVAISPPPDSLAKPTRAPSAVRKTAAPSGAIQASCSCGAPLEIDDEELTSVSTCTQCGIAYHVVIKLEPGSRKKTAIIVPKDPYVGRHRPRSATAAPPPRSTKVKAGRTKAPLPPAVSVPTRGKTRVGRGTVVPVSRAVPKPGPGQQLTACPCGEPLVVGRKDLGKTAPCPRCGTLLEFREERDPQTLAPRVRARAARK